MIDGEIVYLGPDGKPRFYDLMRRRWPQHFVRVWLAVVVSGAITIFAPRYRMAERGAAQTPNGAPNAGDLAHETPHAAGGHARTGRGGWGRLRPVAAASCPPP